MVEKKNYESDVILEEIVASPYKYGFTTDIETEDFPKGINLKTVIDISNKKSEPLFLRKFIHFPLVIILNIEMKELL